MKLIEHFFRAAGISPYFKCPKCGYAEARLVKGDIAYSPCPNCGNSPMYRVK